MSSTSAPHASIILKCDTLHRFLGDGENRVHVLKGVSLELEKGKIYSIAGPSGCGKSTLLYLLGLLDQQDAGSIEIAGQLMSEASDSERTAARNRYLGFVFQFHFLLPEFTAEENVMLPMRKLAELNATDMLKRAQLLLHQVGLGDKTKRFTNQLSGGEQQRVAVARALANQPALILADEPTGNLDASNSEQVFKLLQSIAHEHGQTILMVTHNPELAATTDISLNMRDGVFI